MARERDQNWESPLSDSPDEAPLSLVHEDSGPGEVDGDLDELHQQMAASEEHIANLEGELKEAADQEAETAQRLDSDRQRRAALDQQLHEARKETTIRMLHKASQTRDAMVAGAEELLQASRVQAEREANEMIAIARREAVAIVDAGGEEVRALEDDAAQRMADLDTEHRKLTHRLGVMETIYDELAATLKLVAEISIEGLIETQDSVKQLDGLETQQPPTEPDSEHTTSGSPPQDSSPTDLDAPSALAGDEPASAKVRPHDQARRIIEAALATAPVGEESILEAARREADHMTQDGQAETERMMEQSEANVTSSHDAAGDSLVVDLTHGAGTDETEDYEPQHRWWQRPTRIRG